ncbi:small multi-drug export protein [Oscillibacter valericigenes]|uniref:COG2426 family protein n=1 Tax=Oscillibacter valericigenes TaxID=351091 RepID=UPI001F490D66|nr:small multi-drug export protein [Oscillibacter valericigenes]MCF2617789.1 small multi-drug export protein [Oscillibacter valericigenes]
MIFGESILGKLAMTFAMAMVPVVELRGAIPLGVAAGLPPAVAAVTAMIGNMVPVPFILLLIRKIFRLLRKISWLGPKIDALEQRAHLKGRTVKKYRTLGLVLLVAVPLPGTGAWTGALVADVLDIRMKTALPAIAVGVIIAGCVITALTCGVVSLF